MAGRYIATIDCGSSNVRCILFDMQTGRQIGVASPRLVRASEQYDPRGL